MRIKIFTLIIIGLVLGSVYATAQELNNITERVYIIMPDKSIVYTNIQNNTYFIISIEKIVHFISVRAIYSENKSVLFEILSFSKYLKLYEGQEVYYDLNGNGKTDVGIQLIKVRKGSIDIKLFNFESREKKVDKVFVGSMDIIIVMLIVILSVYIYLYRGKKSKEKRKKKKREPAKM